MAFGIFGGLVALVMLPILAAKGKGWRGLWFGLCIPLALIAWGIGSSPVSTKTQTESQLGHSIDQKTYETMNGIDYATLGLSAGAGLGCLIAGCVYRRRPIAR